MKEKSGYKMFMIYMTPDLHAQAAAYAKKNDFSFCALVRHLLKKRIGKSTAKKILDRI